MRTQKELAKLCSKAADVIERDGLKKGDYGTKDGPKCVLGALRYADCGDPDRSVFYDVRPLFRAARPRSRHDLIVRFNDAARTRKHDVVELLRDMARIGGAA